MVKLLVFAILLASSPATGLIESLFQTENNCYSGCYSHYGATQEHLNACRKGCDFKLLKNDCAHKCIKFSDVEDVRASCKLGCALSTTTSAEDTDKPEVLVDPVPEKNIPETTPVNAQPERPHSIILIRLRQRPSNDFPMMHNFFNSDPMQMFNDMIKRFQERAKSIEESFGKSIEDGAKDFPKLPGFDTVQELPKTIPIIRIPLEVNSDVSSEETIERHPMMMMNGFHHNFDHQRQHMGPPQNRFKQFITDVRTEWNDLIRKQPKIPIWIFLTIFLSSSAILWYMVMTLCRHTPSRETLSIRAQELVFHPYDYEAYEKEKIQPDDQPYEVTESLPIKVKLSNI